MYCKSKSSVILLAVISLCLVLTPASAFADATRGIKVVDDEFSKEQQLVQYAEQWLVNNYSEFYDTRNVESILLKAYDNGDTIEYTVALSCETHYKLDKVEDIPLVKGVMDYSKYNSLTKEDNEVLNHFIESIEQDAFAEEWVGLNVDVVICENKSDKNIPWKMMYDDGLTDQLRDIRELSLNYDELYNMGYNTAREMTSLESYNRQGTDTYNKTFARNYARQYTSNPSTCDVHGSSCGYLQNRSYWNSSVYPNYSGLNHNDCADYVSQALSKGGIPEVTGSSGWYRTKYASGVAWSANWSYVGNLTSYMTSHSYFTSATFANCLAGEVMTTNSGGHVVMVDYNDGTTHRFDGHTNDRCQYAFSNYAGTAYYHVHRWVYPTN